MMISTVAVALMPSESAIANSNSRACSDSLNAVCCLLLGIRLCLARLIKLGILPRVFSLGFPECPVGHAGFRLGHLFATLPDYLQLHEVPLPAFTPGKQSEIADFPARLCARHCR